MLGVDGKCQECASHTYPDEASRECINDLAACAARQYLNELGKCSACADYTYRDDSVDGDGNTGRACTSDVDDCTARQILRTSGRCEDCEAYTYPEATQKRTCVDDSASCDAGAPRQVLGKLGVCETCADGHYVQDGQCIRCQEYHYIDEVDGQCKQETCTGQERLETTGLCVDCPAHYSPDAARRKCI